MSYTVVIEGQKIPLPDEIGSDDVKVRQALAPYFPDAANAMITRTDKSGEVTINVVKKAGTKGLQAGVEYLQACPGGKNPAVALYEEFKGHTELMYPEELLVLDKRIAEALDEGTRQNQAIGQAIKRLIRARPQPAPEVVQGF
jgi:hypothetical protein